MQPDKVLVQAAVEDKQRLAALAQEKLTECTAKLKADCRAFDLAKAALSDAQLQLDDVSLKVG